jgi:HD-GYP domain-containing protein (c-di-GMP phosphodiesterase class II)
MRGMKAGRQEMPVSGDSKPGDPQVAFEVALDAVKATVELRDPYVTRHQDRTAQLAGAIAVELGLDADTCNGIEAAATLHDIGKNGVPAELLISARRLTAAEYEVVKAHVQGGYEVLAPIPFPWPVAQMVLHHHERLDGSGYPAGLLGDDINLGGRILGVADTVEAMSSHRPYREPPGIPAALTELEANRGTRYDRDVVDACLHLFSNQGYEFRT